MRVLAIAALAFAALVPVWAQDASSTSTQEDIVPLMPTDDITPIVDGSPAPTEPAPASTTTYCVVEETATVIVGPGSDIDPYNPAEGWKCYKEYPHGGGTWNIPIGGFPTVDDEPTEGSGKNDTIVKVVAPIVAVLGALLLFGLGVLVIRRRAQRETKDATRRPWFRRQGWVDGSKTDVTEVSKKQPTSMV